MTNKASSFPYLKMTRALLIATTAAAFVVIAGVMMLSMGGERPKRCIDILQTDLFSCDMAKESQK
jgi:hypothetical protein